VNALQDILMLEAGVAAVVIAVLGSLFARVYLLNREATSAFYTAVAFYGIAFNSVCHVISLIANQGNICFAKAYYSIRISGFAVLCACVIYSSWKLLFLNSAEAKE
jgi:membrane-anchored protein YejM (alkaline phosphatase superfamily)